jgi:hypothetical protein
MTVSKAIGLMLTMVGLILGFWFVQQLLLPGPAELTAFIIAAIAVAMLSVGIRYLFKRKPPKKPKPDDTP